MRKSLKELTSSTTTSSIQPLAAEQTQQVKGGGGYTTRPSSGSKYSVQNGSIYLTVNGQTFKMA